jgi:hypothetical protein
MIAMRIHFRNSCRLFLTSTCVTLVASSLAYAAYVPTTPSVHEYRVAVDFGLVSAQGMGAAQSWTTFQDPFEKAFTVEVPQGWTARGGLFRVGYSDERPMVDVISPDGRINVRLGDLAIPSYTVPAQFHNREGDVVDLGAQAQLIVARYRSGPEFAVLYSHARFNQECHQATGDAVDVDFAVPNYAPIDTQPTRTSTGEIAYRCGSGAAQRIAFAYVRTSAQGNLWSAPTLGSFISPPDRVAEARAVLLHIAQTFKLSSQWMQQQKELDAFAIEYQRARQQRRVQEQTQQVRQFEAKMQTMRNQVVAFERHQTAQASQTDGFLQALRGVTPTSGPFNGEGREVWTGTRCTYWTNGSGAVVNTDLAPGGGGWHQMEVLAP